MHFKILYIANWNYAIHSLEYFYNLVQVAMIKVILKFKFKFKQSEKTEKFRHKTRLIFRIKATETGYEVCLILCIFLTVRLKNSNTHQNIHIRGHVVTRRKLGLKNIRFLCAGLKTDFNN